MEGIRRGDESCTRLDFPQSAGVLHGEQSRDTSRYRRIVRAEACGLEGQERERRGRWIRLCLRKGPCFAFVRRRPGAKAPGAVLELDAPQACKVVADLLADTLGELVGLVDALFSVFGTELFSRGDRFDDVDVITWEVAYQEFDSVSEVVREARLDLEYFPCLVFESVEVFQFAGRLPRTPENFGGVVENNPGADVCSGAGGVDAARIFCLQDVVGGSNCLLAL